MDDRDDREVGVRSALAAHARAAFPHECCGYVTAGGVVPCTNVAAEPAVAYEIGGAELLALVRGLGGPGGALAIYHSHTNGRAYFSARDAAIAATASGPVYPVEHIVVGVTATGVAETARFAWKGAAGAYVEVARLAED